VLSWYGCDIFRHTELQGPASYCCDFLGSRKSLKALECCKLNVTFTRVVFRVIPHTDLSIWTRLFQVCKHTFFGGIQFICAEIELRWRINLTLSQERNYSRHI
jgi:hypothetical protein